MGPQHALKELPQAPHNLAGESIDRDKAGQYQIKVSNASGYLCHIHVEVSFFLIRSSASDQAVDTNGNANLLPTSEEQC